MRNSLAKMGKTTTTGEESLEDILATKTRGIPVRIVASKAEYEAALRGPQTTATGHTGGPEGAS